MPTPETKFRTESVIPENWTQTSYTKEEMVNAFLDGMMHQKRSDEDKIQRLFDENIQKAASASEELFHLANKDLNVKLKKAYLKIDSVRKFNTLFIVPKKDYLSTKISLLYHKASDIESANQSDEFHLSFQLMPYSKRLDENCIHSDGYVLEYGEK